MVTEQMYLDEVERSYYKDLPDCETEEELHWGYLPAGI
jgi:hypothetical protein